MCRAAMRAQLWLHAHPRAARRNRSLDNCILAQSSTTSFSLPMRETAAAKCVLQSASGSTRIAGLEGAAIWRFDARNFSRSPRNETKSTGRLSGAREALSLVARHPVGGALTVARHPVGGALTVARRAFIAQLSSRSGVVCRRSTTIHI